MSGSDRWERLEELFHDALEQPVEKRAAWLDAACEGDASLRRELDTLLAADAGTEASPLETLVGHAASAWLTDDTASLTGKTLGRYKVLARIGGGGMGDVYVAADSVLGRQVALKVLRSESLHNPALRRRFEDEARAASALNHPNIVVIHEIGRAAGVDFIASELVEGETLRSRLQSGPLGLRDVLNVGRQTAQALVAAHAAGIVHRDIKPDNLMIRPDGFVKVLDFGIAKLAEMGPSPRVTTVGTVIGTVCYMSPEQALGEPVDHRSDIFSLGVVLYQAATGALPFDGPTDAAVYDALLNRMPEAPGSRRPSLPAELDRIVLRALEKDRELRFQTAADFAAELKRLERVSTAQASRPLPADGDRPQARRGRWPRWNWRQQALLAGAASVAAVVLSVAIAPRLAPAADPAVRRFTVRLPSILEPEQAPGPTAVVSPDGRRLVYVKGPAVARQLAVREMDRFDDHPLPGTEHGHTPFFSPDGARLGFFARGELRTIRLAGGAPSTVVDVRDQRGAAWLPDGTIVFASGGGFLRVPSGGGNPTPVAMPRPELGERGYQWPAVLPDGRTLLYTVVASEPGQAADVAHVHALRLDTGERRPLLHNASFARFARSGHLVFYRGGGLEVVGFDPARLEIMGSPVSIVTQIAAMPAGGYPDFSAGFSVSRDGTLAYIEGSRAAIPRGIFVVSQDGDATPLGSSLAGLVDPHVSPNGRTVAVVARDGLWLFDLEHGSRRQLRPSWPPPMAPVWTPDGRRLVYTRQDEDRTFSIYSVELASPEQETLIWRAGEFSAYPTSFTPDGRVLAITRFSLPAGRDIWTLTLGTGEPKAQALLAGPSTEQHPQFSPDGRWLAYASDESGRSEIYVQPYPSGSGKWQVSADGGVEPRWSRDGTELYFRSGPRMMSVSVGGNGELAPTPPRLLFAGEYQDVGAVIDYDVTREGRRFVMIRPADPEPAFTRVRIVLNWFTELRRIGQTSSR